MSCVHEYLTDVLYCCILRLQVCTSRIERLEDGEESELCRVGGRRRDKYGDVGDFRGSTMNTFESSRGTPSAVGWCWSLGPKSFCSVTSQNGRDLHAMTCGNLNGIPFCVIGEQEQDSNVCNSQGYNAHPSVSGCRVEAFAWNGEGLNAPGPSGHVDQFVAGHPALLDQIHHGQQVLPILGKELSQFPGVQLLNSGRYLQPSQRPKPRRGRALLYVPMRHRAIKLRI